MIRNLWQFLGFVSIWAATFAGAYLLHDPQIFTGAVVASLIFLTAQNMG
jgi:hypothetical protein